MILVFSLSPGHEEWEPQKVDDFIFNFAINKNGACQ